MAYFSKQELTPNPPPLSSVTLCSHCSSVQSSFLNISHPVIQQHGGASPFVSLKHLRCRFQTGTTSGTNDPLTHKHEVDRTSTPEE